MARQVQDQSFYVPGANDPVRAIMPYTPNELVTDGAKPQVPVLGIAILAGVVLLFEHLRRRRGGK